MKMRHPGTPNSSTFPKEYALPKGYAFNILLFLIFVLPAWKLGTFKLGPIITSVREVGLVLLPAVYLIYPSKSSSIRLNTKYWILAFFIILVFTEIIKKFFYGISLFDTIKNFRVAIPLFSGLLICLQGKKIDPEFCLKTLFTALSISFILTPLLVAAGVEPAAFSLEGRDVQIGFLNKGRFSNSNFEFGLMGLALLFYLPKAQFRSNTFKYLLITTSILSVLMLILAFNRTLLAIAFLLGLFLFLKNLQAKTVSYIILAMVIVGSVGGYFYQTNESIQRQVNNRFLVVFQEDEGLAESVYYDNREVLYDIFQKELKENWILGLPGGESLIERDDKSSSQSDISFFNIWIRHGLIVLCIFTILLIIIFFDQRKKLRLMPKYEVSHQLIKTVVVTLPLYVLASFNIDVLVSHNAILFILFLSNFSLTNAQTYSPIVNENKYIEREMSGSR